MILMLIKKYGIPILLTLAVAMGLYSFFDGHAAKNRLTVKDGEYNAVVAEYAEYQEDKNAEIEKLQRYIVVAEEKVIGLVKKVDANTLTLRNVRRTRTELADVRSNLVDKDAIIYNQELQIQEFIKLDTLQETRFNELREAFLVCNSQKDAALLMAKDYFDLLEKEKSLHIMSQAAYAEYRKQVGKRNFKITIKGIGEKVLYAAAGYGLAKVTN